MIRGGRLIVKLANNQIPFSPGYYFFNLPHPLEQVLWSAINRLNAEVEERERGEVKWAVNIQPVSTQESKKFVR